MTASLAPPVAPAVIRLRGVRRVYRLGGEEVQALRGVDLDIHRG